MVRKQAFLPNGETLAYFEQGTGDKVLVLIHGNLSSSLYWEPLLKRLPATIRVVAPDLRGFGDSSYVSRFDSLLELAEDVALLLDLLKIDAFDLVGWSLGGGVAMELAAKLGARVKTLTLLSSTTHKGYPLFQKDENKKPIYGLIYPTKDAMANDPLQVKPVLDALKANNEALMSWIYDVTIYTGKKPEPDDNNRWIKETMKMRCLVDADWALAHLNMSDEPNYYGPGNGRIHQITAKVLHLWGFLDKTVPEYMLLDNATALKGRSSVVRWEQCGHSPLVDKIDELTQVLLDFIQN
jgi:pimeloyl-ACP methyl ester carboxylesterase